MTTLQERKEQFIQHSEYVFSLPLLQNTTKLNKCIRYEIIVEDDTYYTKNYYHPDGKVKRSSSTLCVSKNKGRSNEMSASDQAFFRAYSLWMKKQDQGYKRIDDMSETSVLPMLANKYQDRGLKYLTEPFAVSPKLDGIRAIAYKENNDVILSSRGNKPFVFLETIKKHLSFILTDEIVDGELYAHDIPFNLISGITSSSKTIHPDDAKCQYWIFDIINDEPYSERMKTLNDLQKKYKSLFNDNVIVFLGYTSVNHNHVDVFHKQYIRDGYEGLIARELSSKYEVGKRSNYLLKYKEFEDAEYPIVDYKTGVGNEKDAIIFICSTNEERFSVRPRGSIDYRKQMYQRGDTFIGKLLTVRYQEKSETGIPRFPVGIVRDYE